MGESSYIWIVAAAAVLALLWWKRQQTAATYIAGNNLGVAPTPPDPTYNPNGFVQPPIETTAIVGGITGAGLFFGSRPLGPTSAVSGGLIGAGAFFNAGSGVAGAVPLTPGSSRPPPAFHGEPPKPAGPSPAPLTLLGGLRNRSSLESALRGN